MSYTRYFAIEKELKDKGHRFERSQMVADFTKGKKDGLRQLSAAEYRELCRAMEYMLNPNKEPDKKQTMRRKIIALFHKMNYKLPGGKANMERIEEWCNKYGQYHKDLNKHNYKELVSLCTQVEQVYMTFVNGLE